MFCSTSATRPRIVASISVEGPACVVPVVPVVPVVDVVLVVVRRGGLGAGATNGLLELDPEELLPEELLPEEELARVSTTKALATGRDKGTGQDGGYSK